MTHAETHGAAGARPAAGAVPGGALFATADASTIIDYARSLDCIHCGLCLHTCPTYRLTGAEPSSPRGRIHLMRAVAEGKLEADAEFAEEMGFCLVCRHCESVCPAGVQFGTMMEHTRDALAARGPSRPGGASAARMPWTHRLARRIGFGVLLRKRPALRIAVGLLALGQRTGVLRLVAPLLGERGRALARFPRVPARRERRPLPARTAPRGASVASVALLEGCVMPELFGRVNRATARVLNACGEECHRPAGHTCCGALHAHNGDLAGARALARETIAAFDGLVGDGGEPLAIVVNSAGCAAHMKEYPRLLADDEPDVIQRAGAFAARVFDFSEYLAQAPRLARLRAELELATRRPGSPEADGASPGAAVGPTLTYDDPCHLCHGQGIRAQPRTLLDLVPGVHRVELADSEGCCGSAGIYSMLRPADSQSILEEKLAALQASGADVLVTANPGCQLQWQSGVDAAGGGVRVQHLAEVLAEALEGR